VNITGEQARLIAQTDAMVQQEQGRKWAEPQVEAPDMVDQPEPAPLLDARMPPVTAARGGIEYVAVDPTREGTASHFTVQRDGRIQQHVDYTNMEANVEQFSGSLRQAIDRATAQFNNLADVLIHTSERFR
jgi:hypothetical protein